MRKGIKRMDDPTRLTGGELLKLGISPSMDSGCLEGFNVDGKYWSVADVRENGTNYRLEVSTTRRLVMSQYVKENPVSLRELESLRKSGKGGGK